MSMVNFWNGPKANYNAETHKNGIYQCTDTGDTYMFGSLNSGKGSDDFRIITTSDDFFFDPDDTLDNLNGMDLSDITESYLRGLFADKILIINNNTAEGTLGGGANRYTICISTKLVDFSFRLVWIPSSGDRIRTMYGSLGRSDDDVYRIQSFTVSEILIPTSIPEVPQGIITSRHVGMVSKVDMASSLPSNPDRNTLYLIFPEADDFLSGEGTLG